MSLPKKEKKSQSAWLDLAVFAAVLGFLVYSIQAILGFAQKSTVQETVSALKLPDSPERKPATIGAAEKPQSPTTGPAAGLGTSTEVLRLPCLKETASTNFASSARLLQIHAPACAEDLKHVAGWKGLNLTSGEEIIVFVNAKEKILSTSYFTLRDGENKITLTHEFGGAGKAAPEVRMLKIKK